MPSRVPHTWVLLHPLVLLVFASTCAEAQYNPVKAKRYIAAALPETATVKPRKSRRLLVFTKTNGFRHESISSGVMSLRMLGEKTGAYSIVHTEDASLFEKDSLNTFDAVCMLNTSREVFLPRNLKDLSDLERKAAFETDERLKTNFKEFITSGKGLVGFHAATDTFHQWNDYGMMIGGLFGGHPWNQEIGVKVEETNHPLTRAFGGRSFKVADEIYQFTGNYYSRDRLRVLLTLDMKSVPNHGARADQDYALAWIQQVGKGRVFYTAFGHRDQIFWNATLLKFFLDGIQFGLGDLAADATPVRSE